MGCCCGKSSTPEFDPEQNPFLDMPSKLNANSKKTKPSKQDKLDALSKLRTSDVSLNDQGYTPYSPAFAKALASSDISASMLDFPKFVAIHNYQPGSDSELSLQIGDQLYQADAEIDSPANDPDWIFAMRDGSPLDRRNIGCAPRNCLGLVGSVEECPYYFGILTGRETEDILQRKPDGVFLVRRRPEIIVKEDDKLAGGSLLKKGSEIQPTRAKSAREGSIRTETMCDPGKAPCPAYVLAVQLKKETKQIPISHLRRISDDTYYVEPKRAFLSIKDLIEFYQDSHKRKSCSSHAHPYMSILISLDLRYTIF